MFEWIAFTLLSIVIIYFSRASLRHPRSHGFYRFFAWEAIAGLIALNLPGWFNNPFAIHQVISWILLIASIYFVTAGLLLLRQRGKPQSTRQDDSLFEMEKTTQLVTSGLYRFIRHPLYSSLLCLGWGAFFKHPAWFGLILAVLATFFLSMTAHIEEKENVRTFGAAYQNYMKHSKRFIPFVY